MAVAQSKWSLFKWGLTVVRLLVFTLLLSLFGFETVCVAQTIVPFSEFTSELHACQQGSESLGDYSYWYTDSVHGLQFFMIASGVLHDETTPVSCTPPTVNVIGNQISMTGGDSLYLSATEGGSFAGGWSVDVTVQSARPIACQGFTFEPGKTVTVSPFGYLDCFRNSVSDTITFTNLTIGEAPPPALSLTLAKPEVYPLLPSVHDGSNQTVVTAHLNGNATDISDKIILFSSTPEEFSGGHNHSGGRPTGTFPLLLGSAFCITDSTGQCSITFSASEVSGVESISAWAADDPSKQSSINVDVKVPGLINLAGHDICLFGVCSSVIYELKGQTDAHPSNHFLTATSQLAIFGVAYDFYNEFQAKLRLDDMSLESGGLFDIGTTVQLPNGLFWKTPHKSHRVGTSVDVKKCAKGTIAADPADRGDCDLGEVEVPKLDRFQEICNNWGGHLANEPQIHCEFKQ